MLKVWIFEVFGRKNLGFEEVVKELRVLDDVVANVSESVPSSVSRNRSLAQSCVWEQLHQRESIIRQNSRCTWFKEGDQNSKYFHSFMKARQKGNCIFSLFHEDSIIEDVDEINSLVFDHFNCTFKDPNLRRHKLEGVCFKKLYVEDKVNLEAPLFLLDIKDIIWYSAKGKILNSDGFTVGFYKVACDIIVSLC
ncbi:uncharacterized protein LOC127096024 [Lathyrus oleraceus]|uniref:uncharacterized protein LOC127096024 n=1 Tax=Pisum sativum TaxID=3888 RepID=UPI0021D17814|nr:uncharacterized protein LOC127096024 [Pisum sativum]